MKGWVRNALQWWRRAKELEEDDDEDGGGQSSVRHAGKVRQMSSLLFVIELWWVVLRFQKILQPED